MMKNNLILLSLVSVLLAGCSLSPKLEVPKMDFPQESSLNSNENKTLIDNTWWEKYKDKRLSLLIDEAFKNNYNLQETMLNISLARAILTSSTSDRYPSLNLGADGEKTKTSANTFQNSKHNTYNNFSLSGVLNYEVDLWGKVREAQKASKALLISSYAQKDTVKLALASNVADSYFILISLYEKLDVIQKAVNAKEESLKISNRQYSSGIIIQNILFQKKAELNRVKLLKNEIKQSINLQESALATLIGKSPKEIINFKNENFAKKLPNDIVVPSNLSSDILNKRPDIQEAEQKLIATNSQVGVAKAEYFPSISLSGILGYESLQLTSLVGSKSGTNSYGGNISMPFLNWGKVNANVRTAKTNKELAILAYRQTVQLAFQEVYDALNIRHSLSERLVQQISYEKNLEEIYKISQKQYENGYSDYINLKDAEYDFLIAQIDTITTKQALLSSGLTVYKSLGGGWNKNSFFKEVKE
ncbi:efflux transporter outer membrane subunit [Arcobacter sp.]|uniref:efflux transporter outer membrane subunit n=1 Tax=unclassified Arcobacter TaxID=2593671 RepID=UPI003AFFD7FC